MRNELSCRTGKRARLLQRMAAMRAAKERKRIDRGVPERGECKVAAGTFLGVLQWHGADGGVHRIAVRQGKRANQIRILGCRKDHGFDWLLRKLRERLSVKRISSNQEHYENIANTETT